MLHFKVSVVIPVYDVENYIDRAIDSVLQQEEVTELILVEDGSSDDSLQICLERQKLDNRIIVLTHPENKNKGVSASRNLGIKNAKNEFLAFLDGDDYYLKNRFEVAKQCFLLDETIDGVYEAISLHHNLNDINAFSLTKSLPPKSLFAGLSPIGREGWFSANGLTVRLTIFKKSGFFDEDLRTSEDTLLWLKMAASSKLVAGNILKPVAVTERIEHSLSANKLLVDKDQIRMLYKLYFWINKVKIENVKEKKELILNAIVELTTNKQNLWISRLSNIVLIIFKIGLRDGKYIINSKRIRRMVGNFIGYT